MDDSEYQTDPEHDRQKRPEYNPSTRAGTNDQAH